MRPAFHFTAERGWINDPHGIAPRGERYEVFFQLVPGAVRWAPACEWGHATGATLFDLVEQEPVLRPGDGDDGIFTGCLVQADDGDRIFYTSVAEPDLRLGSIRVARPHDESWATWGKGPVAVVAPEHLHAFRDPTVVRDGESWRMLVGAALPDGSGAVLGWTSPDLETWTQAGVVASRLGSARSPVWTGSMWECPQLVRVGERWVLVVSVWDADSLHHVAAAVGDLVEGRFRADAWTQLTVGPVHYAPTSFTDLDGRPCLLFWLRGVQDEDAGWAGAHSVPYLLHVDGDRVVCTPHPDLDRFRTDEPLGTAADVVWSGRGRLTVRDAEGALLTLDVAGGELHVDAGNVHWSVRSTGTPIRLVLDGPVAEWSSADGVMGAVLRPPVRPLRIDVYGAGLRVHALTRD